MKDRAMTLSHGRPYLAIPGPSVMPDRVLAAMHRPAPNIYAGDLIDMTASLIPDLKAVARTKHHATIYIGNGHSVWEASLANVLNPGDKVLVPATGRFGHGWAEMAERLGADVEILDFGKSADMDLDAVEATLRADKTHQIKAILAVHVDTSSGVRNDIEALRARIDAAKHPALLMADCIASLGCDRFEMDAWGVDIMVTGCQKGLMTPPGLGFLFFNDKADAARDQVERVSAYWDWRPRANVEMYYQYFCGTAPTHHLYGLREALNMLVHEEGIEAAWARHATLARTLWSAFDAWGTKGAMALNIKDPSKRSHAVTAACLPDGKATALREWCEQQAGVTLGIGLGMAEPDSEAWNDFFRVGHMGHVNAQMMMAVLGTMDAGLKALNIPHGAGALEAASQVLATG